MSYLDFVLPNSHIIFKSAVKEGFNGRPMNGMFIAVPNEIKENFSDVSPDHWRVQAAIMNTNEEKVLILNTYFPTDGRTLRFDDTELLEVFHVIDNVIQENDFTDICWGGDINSDFIRNTGFVQSVDRFIGELNLVNRVCHKIEKLPILHGPMILLCNFVMRSQIKKPFLKRLIFT